MPITLSAIFHRLILAMLLLTPLFLLTNQHIAPAKDLETFLNENNAPMEEQEAYRFAMQHPKILQELPCYCGCMQKGHKSNYNCFFRNNQRYGKPVTIDDHGLNCRMCVQIALTAKMLFNKKVPLESIQTEVDKYYKKYAPSE